MNTKRAQPRIQMHQAPATGSEQDYEQLNQLDAIEHLTIPGFLRRVPHKWHIDEINRFGDKVGRTAESLQLAYLTTVDRSLGVIRVFPAPLLQRVYTILAPQFGWPQIIDVDAPELENGKRSKETLRSHELLSKHLHKLLSAAGDIDVQHSIAVVLQWLERDSGKMRGEKAENPPADANPTAAE